MNKVFTQPIGLATLLALITTIVVSFSANMFSDKVERMTAWQVGLTETPLLHPAITVIALKEKNALSCGKTTIHRARLAQTISALSQAEAKVIAPMFHLEGPSSSACGGAAADANLIEATTLSGRVIYPASVFEPIKNQAQHTGSLRQETFPNTNTQPLGFAIAKGYDKERNFLTDLATDFPSRMKEDLPTYEFKTIWNLIETERWKELRTLAKDKIIILSPEMNKEVLTQIKWLNAALTNSWLHPIETGKQFFIMLLFSCSTAWIFLRHQNWKGNSAAFVLVSAFVVIAGFLQVQFGLILPLITLGLAFLALIIAVKFIQARTKKIQASAHLLNLRRDLSQLQNELTMKEKKAHALMESLEAARLANQESSDRLKTFEMAQVEVEATRKQLHAIEAELRSLRENTAETIEEPSPLQPDLASLSIECQSFGIITKDPKLLKVFSDIKKAAKSLNPILLLGETGTGKEVFARAAHRLSDRSRRPFIPVNMAAIRPELFESELFGHVKGAFTGAIGSKGYVEAAEGGTLFLDEMGELSLDLQAKLLRLLENHTFNRVGEAQTRQANVRILVATNRDLKHEVAQGRFREDLYYRLRSIVLVLPALRERVPEDRRLLAEHFLQQCANQENRASVQLSPDALQTIVSYTWHGNIRELKQTLSQAISLAETHMIRKADLRLDDHPSSPTQYDINRTPKQPSPKKAPNRDDATILTALRQHRFDMGTTAQALNCDRSTITQRLKGLGYEALVKSKGDFALAAKDLADDDSLQDVVEQKLREYEGNLLPRRKRYPSVEDAIADCRRRFKNLPDRYFPSVEILIRSRFSAST